jgi:hypothetical protein
MSVAIVTGSAGLIGSHYPHWVHTYDVAAILAEMYETNRATWVSR